MAKEKGTDEILSQLGIDRSDPDQAVEKLRSLHASGVEQSQIAAAAGLIATPASAQLLARMEAGASGALRREIRRSLFKLRQHGIEAPVEASARPAPALAAAESLTAILSPADPEGAQLVWLVKPRPQGGLSRLYGLTSESDGLVGATLVHLSRRELREERRDIERRTSVKLIDADYHLGDFILCEAYRRTPQARRGQVGNFLALRAEILAEPPPLEYRHPIYDEFAATLDQEASPDLFKEAEVADWRIPEAELKPYLSEIEEIRQSPLVLNQYQQQERINAVAGRALEQLIAGPRRDAMRRRLENTAFYLARTGRPNAARWAASAAARIRDGHNLGRSPFFVELVMRSIGQAMSHQRQETEQQPRLIMTPAEAMRAQAARARRLRR